MSKRYGPVKKLFSETWALGIIENHQARLLTFEEIEEVCERLNASQEQPRTIPEALRAHRWRPTDGE